MGKSELPTSIEIYQNSLPIYQKNLEAGRFDISNIPVISSGRGELTAKMQDITGRISTVTIPHIT